MRRNWLYWRWYQIQTFVGWTVPLFPRRIRRFFAQRYLTFLDSLVQREMREKGVAVGQFKSWKCREDFVVRSWNWVHF